MKIAAFQFDVCGDIRKNYSVIEGAVTEAARQGAQLIVFPECALCGYPPRDIPDSASVDLKETTAMISKLQDLSVTKNISIIFGTVAYGHAYRNRAYIIVPGQPLKWYDKRALWGWDKDNFSEGNESGIVNIGGLTIGIRICFEVRFPEFFRELYKADTDLNIVLFNDVCDEDDISRYEMMRAHLITRAVENATPVLSVNSAHPFQGAPTCFIGPSGEVLCEHDQNESGMMIWDFEKKEPDFGEKGRITVSDRLLALSETVTAEVSVKRDELTGANNNTAFMELSQSMDNSIRKADADLRFGIVICDVNDMKRYNDTGGHSFGDDILRRAYRMISDNFVHSQVFRVNGAEFAVYLTEEEYDIREELLENLRRESYANGRSRSGPVIATGISVYEPSADARFSDVVKRADLAMYENKKMLKSGAPVERTATAIKVEIPIPDGRKKKLDAMFNALLTVADGEYVFLNDLRYDYSRWSKRLVDDYGFESEYMYHAGKIWQEYVHPDDLDNYTHIVDSLIHRNGDPKELKYRARRLDGSYVLLQPKAFILCDNEGKPEYYGGIVIPGPAT